MNGTDTSSYRFNLFLLDVAERQLFLADTAVPLTPKAFDVLAYLVAHSGHLVLKDDLLQAIWPDSFVDEVNIPRTIHTIRRALGEHGNGDKFIETVPTKGYRFVAQVERVKTNGASLLSYEKGADPTPARVAGIDADDGESNSVPHMRLGSHERITSRGIPARTLLILATVLIVALAVSGYWLALRSETSVAESSNPKLQTNNGEAYQNFQQGRFLLERMHDGDIEDAVASFERAIRLDPQYAAAYVGKADAKIWTFWGSGLHDDISQARTAINTAIELDESNSYAHTLLCRIKGTYDWDFAGAERECRRAIELDPSDHEAHREMAFFLSAFDREQEAMQEIDKAVLLAPTSFNKRSRGIILYYSRRYDEAIEQLRQVEDTDPNRYDTSKWLINACEMKRDYPAALQARVRQMEYEGKTSEEIEAVKTAFAIDGWPGVLRKTVDGQGPRLAAAATYAQLGESDKAFESLEKLSDRRAILMIHIDREPRLDPLRNDPRFDALLRRVGLK